VGEYAFSSAGVIGGAPAEIMRWLATPELMIRWIPYAKSVEPTGGPDLPAGAVFRLFIRDTGYGTPYLGEVRELTETRLVRRYTLPHQTEELARAAEGKPPDYERIVTYELGTAPGGTAPGGTAPGGTALRCSVVTSIPGLAASVARMATRSEGKGLTYALDRLRACVEGRPLPRKFTTTAQQAL